MRPILILFKLLRTHILSEQYTLLINISRDFRLRCITKLNRIKIEIDLRFECGEIIFPHIKSVLIYSFVHSRIINLIRIRPRGVSDKLKQTKNTEKHQFQKMVKIKITMHVFVQIIILKKQMQLMDQRDVFINVMQTNMKF